MIGTVINNIFIKNNEFNIGFLIVVFDTSSGFFKLDNCHLCKIDNFEDFAKYKREDIFNDLNGLKITGLFMNFEMDFAIKFEKSKILIIGSDSDFNKPCYSQIIQVYDINSLSHDYLEEMTNYKIS